MQGYRTDLAAEDVPQDGGALPGVRSEAYDRDGFHVTRVEVTDDRGASALCKPIGTYITLDVETFFRRRENSFAEAAGLMAELLRGILPLPTEAAVLVAALGNPAITPDAVGPETAALTLATRHLRAMLPEEAPAFRPVSVFRAGVLGTTGIESAEAIRALCRAVRPDAVVIVDALASRSPEKLCRTVQIADSGIVPGSGVGNDRAELSRRVLGVPVTAIGVPTVVDVGEGRIVTLRDIDRCVRDAGKLIAYALNLALHPSLSLADVDMFVG